MAMADAARLSAFCARQAHPQIADDVFELRRCDSVCVTVMIMSLWLRS
jgi:hypothetical protein